MATIKQLREQFEQETGWRLRAKVTEKYYPDYCEWLESKLTEQGDELDRKIYKSIQDAISGQLDEAFVNTSPITPANDAEEWLDVRLGGNRNVATLTWGAWVESHDEYASQKVREGIRLFWKWINPKHTNEKWLNDTINEFMEIKDHLTKEQ